MENNQRQIIAAMMMQAFILRGEGTIEEAVKMADELIEALGINVVNTVKTTKKRRCSNYVEDGKVYVYKGDETHGYLTFDALITDKVKRNGWSCCSIVIGKSTYVKISFEGDIKIDARNKNARAWCNSTIVKMMHAMGFQPCTMLEYNILGESNESIILELTKQ